MGLVRRNTYICFLSAVFLVFAMFNPRQRNTHWVAIVMVRVGRVYLDGGRTCAISDFEVTVGQEVLQHMVFNPGCTFVSSNQQYIFTSRSPKTLHC